MPLIAQLLVEHPCMRAKDLPLWNKFHQIYLSPHIVIVTDDPIIRELVPMGKQGSFQRQGH